MRWPCRPAVGVYSVASWPADCDRSTDGEILAATIGNQTVVDLDDVADLPLSLRRSERINTVVVYGESFILKTFRQIEEGVNPDLEIGRYLADAA